MSRLYYDMNISDVGETFVYNVRSAKATVIALGPISGQIETMKYGTTRLAEINAKVTTWRLDSDSLRRYLLHVW